MSDTTTSIETPISTQRDISITKAHSQNLSKRSRSFEKPRICRRLFSFPNHANRRWLNAVKQATMTTELPALSSSIADIRAATIQGGDTADKTTPIGAILPLLRTRMRDPNWPVVLKTQYVFHDLFRKGNPRFVNFLAAVPSDTFDQMDFVDQSGSSDDHGPFIRAYTRFLARWITMHGRTAFPFNAVRAVETTYSLKEASVEQLLADVSYLLHILEAVQAFPLEESFKQARIFQPVYFCLMHDLRRFLRTLSTAMCILVSKFFTMPSSLAVPTHQTFQRYIGAHAGVLPFIMYLRTTNPLLATPEKKFRLPFPVNLADQMRDYLANGCIHESDELEGEVAVRMATVATDLPATDGELQAVLKWGGSIQNPGVDKQLDAILKALTERLYSTDWRLLIKSLVLFRALLHGADRRLVERLAEAAERCFGPGFGGSEVADCREAEIHAPLMLWYASYLKLRASKMKTALFESEGPCTAGQSAMLESNTPGSRIGNEDARKLIRSLSRGMDLIDALQAFYVDDDLISSALARQVYCQIVVDVREVFLAVVRRMNGFVRMFFELEKQIAVDGFSVYGRFVTLMKEVGEPGCVFARAEKVSQKWQKPNENIGETYLFDRMRIHVERLRQSDGH